MGQKIAAPAETYRRLARDASLKADEQEKKGNLYNAKSLRLAAEVAYDAAAGRSSNLVSIEAEHASTLAAFVSHSNDYVEGLAAMLRHQNYW
jgi:hypothetical protein